jgi:hypothetical protein
VTFDLSLKIIFTVLHHLFPFLSREATIRLTDDVDVKNPEPGFEYSLMEFNQRGYKKTKSMLYDRSHRALHDRHLVHQVHRSDALRKSKSRLFTKYRSEVIHVSLMSIKITLRKMIVNLYFDHTECETYIVLFVVLCSSLFL